MAKDTLWFKHDYHARNDEKVLELRSQYGAEGYGVFMMIVESLAENGTSGINKGIIGGLSLGYGVDKTKLLDIISTCIKIGLIYEENDAYFSGRMLKHAEERVKFKESGKEGAEKRWKNKEK